MPREGKSCEVFWLRLSFEVDSEDVCVKIAWRVSGRWKIFKRVVRDVRQDASLNRIRQGAFNIKLPHEYFSFHLFHLPLSSIHLLRLHHFHFRQHTSSFYRFQLHVAVMPMRVDHPQSRRVIIRQRKREVCTAFNCPTRLSLISCLSSKMQ